MILVAIGANLPSDRFGPPLATCEAAVSALEQAEIHVARRSRWYESAPVPVSDQPWFVNGVVRVETTLTAGPLLRRLHAIEADFGRRRDVINGPRVLDLDLLDYDGRLMDGEEGVILPHPRLEQRAFVLLPLAEIAPDWRHPRTGASLESLIAALPGGQTARPLQAFHAGRSL